MGPRERPRIRPLLPGDNGEPTWRRLELHEAGSQHGSGLLPRDDFNQSSRLRSVSRAF